MGLNIVFIMYEVVKLEIMKCYLKKKIYDLTVSSILRISVLNLGLFYLNWAQHSPLAVA